MFIPHVAAKYVARLTISLITAASMVLLKDYLHNRKGAKRRYR